MKQTILFLAANPLGTDRLALDQEARAIAMELERSRHRDQFELVTRWAPEPLDLLRELRRIKPSVVHFSGHGEPGRRRPDPASRRDIVIEQGALDGERQSGLFFQGEDGRPQLVPPWVLVDAFAAAGSSVRLVVLSACYNEAHAEALLGHVDCVVGTGGSISDDAARTFAVGFYGGLEESESVLTAFRQGRAAVSLERLRDGELPRLKVRDGIDAQQLTLKGAPYAPPPRVADPL